MKNIFKSFLCVVLIVILSMVVSLPSSAKKLVEGYMVIRLRYANMDEIHTGSRVDIASGFPNAIEKAVLVDKNDEDHLIAVWYSYMKPDYAMGKEINVSPRVIRTRVYGYDKEGIYYVDYPSLVEGKSRYQPDISDFIPPQFLD